MTCTWTGKLRLSMVTHRGCVTRSYVTKLWHSLVQIFWTIAGLLSIGPVGTYFSEIWIKTQQYSLNKISLKMSSGKLRPSCLGLNVFTELFQDTIDYDDVRSLAYVDQCIQETMRLHPAAPRWVFVWPFLLSLLINSSPPPPGQNGRLFADDVFRCIFVNEKFFIWVKISLKFVTKGPVDNNPALVQIMAWHRIGDKLLSKPMLTWFTDAYICVTRGRGVNSLRPKQTGKWNLNHDVIMLCICIMTSWLGNAFRVTVPLWGGSTGHRTKGQ